MRIDLPACGFKDCRHSFDGTCAASGVRRESCEYRYFRDSERDGLLVRLPCKVGDTVYWVEYGTKKPIKSAVVQDITIHDHSMGVKGLYAVAGTSKTGSKVVVLSGGYFYTSRAEAEAALKEATNEK